MWAKAHSQCEAGTVTPGTSGRSSIAAPSVSENADSDVATEPLVEENADGASPAMSEKPLHRPHATQRASCSARRRRLMTVARCTARGRANRWRACGGGRMLTEHPGAQARTPRRGVRPNSRKHAYPQTGSSGKGTHARTRKMGTAHTATLTITAPTI